MVSLGNDREIHHWIDYTTSGNLEDKTRVDEILGEKLINTPTVEYFDSNATQRRTRYARNAIFLFIGNKIRITGRNDAVPDGTSRFLFKLS